jgi:hypothetical protein
MERLKQASELQVRRFTRFLRLLRRLAEPRSAGGIFFGVCLMAFLGVRLMQPPLPTTGGAELSDLNELQKQYLFDYYGNEQACC